MAVALAAGPLWPLVVYGEIVEGHPVRTGVPWGGYRPWVGVFSIGAEIAAYGEVPIQADLQLKPQLSVLEERRHTELLTAAPYLSEHNMNAKLDSSLWIEAAARIAKRQHEITHFGTWNHEVHTQKHRAWKKNVTDIDAAGPEFSKRETTMGHVKNIFIILRTN